MKRIILLLLILGINLISCTSGDGITLDQIQGDVRQKSDVVEYEVYCEILNDYNCNSKSYYYDEEDKWFYK